MDSGSIGINQLTTMLHFIIEVHVRTQTAAPSSLKAFHRLENVIDCSECDCDGIFFRWLSKHFNSSI